MLGNDVMLGQVKIRQGIYEQSSKKKIELGFVLPFKDGRRFVYCENAAVALVRGFLIQSKTIDDTYDVDLALASAVEDGDKEITLTIDASHASFDANEYEDGYVLIETMSSQADQSQMRKIKSHPAFTTGTETDVTFKLKDEFEDDVAISGSYARIWRNPHKDVVVAAGGGPIVGVPLIDVTASYYFWAQCWGDAPLVNDNNSTISIGDGLMHNDNGEVRTHTAGEQLLGYALGASDDSDDSLPAFLQIR